MKLQKWFLGKLNEEQLTVALSKNATIVGETEKAIKLELDQYQTEFRIISLWIPKSAIMSEQEIAEENLIEYIQEEVEPVRDQMLEVLKSNKIKVTTRTKNATLVSKIIENGLVNAIVGYDLVDGQYGQYFKLNDLFKEAPKTFVF